MKKTIFILSVIFLTSCAKVLTPKQSDVQVGTAKFPGLTLAQLDEGRTLFKHRCTQCHLAKNPTSRDEEEWRDIVPKMAAKAEKKTHKKKIPPADQELILKYLITMSDSHNKK